jgi:hypothetical protein
LLPSVATGGMVIGYCHENQNVARKCSIATAMPQVATFFLVAARTIKFLMLSSACGFYFEMINFVKLLHCHLVTQPIY